MQLRVLLMWFLYEETFKRTSKYCAVVLECALFSYSFFFFSFKKKKGMLLFQFPSLLFAVSIFNCALPLREAVASVVRNNAAVK